MLHIPPLRRACFKRLPHILCFNTMRYTFNMNTMMREKVNTLFSFPLHLDMSGYLERSLMPNKCEDGTCRVGAGWDGLIRGGTWRAGRTGCALVVDDRPGDDCMFQNVRLFLKDGRSGLVVKMLCQHFGVTLSC